MQYSTCSHFWHQALLLVALLTRSVHSISLDLTLEHSLGDSWSSAGQIQGDFKAQTRYQSQQTSTVLEFERLPLQQGARQALEDLVAKDGLYQLRLRPKEEGRLPVLTSIPARCLVSPVCKEQVDVHVAPDGSVLGLNYAFPLCPCSKEYRQQRSLPPGWQFAEVVPAPLWTSKQIPPLQIVPKSEVPEGKPAKQAAKQQAPPKVHPETGEVQEPPKDERSFLQKNWMILLPVGFLVVNVLGGLTGEQGGAQQSAARARRAA